MLNFGASKPRAKEEDPGPRAPWIHTCSNNRNTGIKYSSRVIMFVKRLGSVHIGGNGVQNHRSELSLTVKFFRQIFALMQNKKNLSRSRITLRMHAPYHFIFP